jgi:hypothetical protein
MNEAHFTHRQLSIEECRKLMKDNSMTDEEIEEFLKNLRSFLNDFLEDYFQSEFDPIEV